MRLKDILGDRETPDHLHAPGSPEEGAEKLASILENNGYTRVGRTNFPFSIVLKGETQQQKIAVMVRGGEICLEIVDDLMPGDTTFRDAVFDVIRRSSDEFQV